VCWGGEEEKRKVRWWKTGGGGERDSGVLKVGKRGGWVRIGLKRGRVIEERDEGVRGGIAKGMGKELGGSRGVWGGGSGKRPKWW